MRAVPALLIALLGLSSCGRSSSPVEQNPAAAVVAVAGSDSAPSGVTSPPSLRVSDGTLTVLGVISTPDPCQSIRVFAERTGDARTVVVEATSRGETCIAVLGSFAYRYVAALTPGSHRVRVEHRYRNTGWSTEVVRDTVIMVP